MAELTLKTLRDTLRFRGDYQNIRKFPDAAVNVEIQCAFGDLWQLVADTHEGWWDTDGTVTTTIGVNYVALPKTAWRVLAVDLLDGDAYVEIPQVGVDQRNRFGTGTGRPLAHRLTSRGIELMPPPDSAYTLRVTFTPMAPSLAESQPREWYNGWEDYVIEGALLALDKREGKPLSDRLASLEVTAKKITAGATERRSQEPEYIPLREFGDYDPFRDGLL